MEEKKELLISEIGRILHIASDATRIRILYTLLDEDSCERVCPNDCTICSTKIEKTVGEIVEETGASQSLVSHQLKVLRDAKLVTTRKVGKNVYYSLMDHHIKVLLEIAKEHILEEASSND